MRTAEAPASSSRRSPVTAASPREDDTDTDSADIDDADIDDADTVASTTAQIA